MPIAMPAHSRWSLAERIVLIAICIATLCFVFITPPFQSPDESQHYIKAEALSEGKVLAQVRGSHIGADVPHTVADLHTIDFPSEVAGHHPPYTLDQIKHAWAADSYRKGKAFADFPNVASYAPTLYAPQAAGIWLGTAMGLPQLGGFYLGRIINALVALGLLAFAAHLLPFGRLVLLGVAALPTTVYQAGSLSPDAFINGISFLGLAVSITFGLSALSRGRSIALLAIAPVLALAKGVYLPVLLAGLRWPDVRQDYRPWIMLGAAALGAGSFLAWMYLNGGTQALYYVMSRKTGEHFLTAPMSEQLAVILHDPVGYVRVLISSVAERAPVYAVQIVGRFGWNAILLPFAAYALAVVMLVSAVLCATGGAQLRWPVRAWWLLLAIGGGILVETALYLTGTPLGADYIQGTQGRYFLPLLPLVGLALMPGRANENFAPSQRLFATSAIVLLIIGLATAVDSFWITGFTVHDGLPPFDKDAAGVGRALFLPSPRWTD